MGEYEPRDSRNVTLNPHRAPGEPPRTGPREGETRQPQQSELEQDERGEEAEAVAGQVGAADAGAEAALRERAMDRDAEELGAPGEDEGPERFDRND